MDTKNNFSTLQLELFKDSQTLLKKLDEIILKLSKESKNKELTRLKRHCIIENIKQAVNLKQSIKSFYLLDDFYPLGHTPPDLTKKTPTLSR